jgi:hypothetical protein
VDDAAFVKGFAPDGLEGFAVAREDGTKALLHIVAHGNFVKGAPDESADNLFDELVIGVALNDLHQLQSGRGQLNALRWRIIKRAVNDVRPVDERVERFVAEIKMCIGDIGDKFDPRSSI